jgi:putative spermidine/putrescine transport system substrate-binding protein
MFRVILGLLAISSTGILDAMAADKVTVAVFPLENKDAIEAAYLKPFQKATGVTVQTATYDGQAAPIVNMVKAGKTTWDVVQAESRMLDVGCREGWFEKIDPKKLADKEDFVPGTITECGVAIFAWSQAFAYNADKVAGTPTSWADFWDVKKFPGLRGLRRSAKYTLEIALLADGVAPADVYNVLATRQGVDRAFRKLDEIKADTFWWQASPQPALLLAADKLVMSSAYPPWIDMESKAGKNLKVVWKGSLYDFDSWAIPKGTPRIDDAYRFIAFAGKPENQKAFSLEVPYGPVNRKALPMLDPKLASQLPTAEANLKGAVAINTAFWIQNGRELEKRFDQWAPPLAQTADQIEEIEHGGKGHKH